MYYNESQETEMENVEMNDYEAIPGGDTDAHTYLTVGESVATTDPAVSSKTNPKDGETPGFPCAYENLEGPNTCQSAKSRTSRAAAVPEDAFTKGSSCTTALTYANVEGRDTESDTCLSGPRARTNRAEVITKDATAHVPRISRRTACTLLVGVIMLCAATSAITGVIVYQMISGSEPPKLATPPDQSTKPAVNISEDLIGRMKSIVLAMVEEKNTSVQTHYDNLSTRIDAVNSSHAQAMESRTHDTIIEKKRESSAQAQYDNLTKRIDSINTNQAMILAKREETNRKWTSNLEKMASAVQTQYDTIKRQMDSMSSSHSQVLSSLTNTNQKCDALGTKLSSLGRQVAFSVSNARSTLTRDLTPTFTNIMLNLGGGYNAATGKFMCPVGGIYILRLSIRHEDTNSGDPHCYFRVNGVVQTVVIAYWDASEQASMTRIVQLNVGDVVDAQCFSWLYVLPNDTHGATFGGVLITPS